ncbi:exo-beta-1,3-glucanase [Crucibulum laeve]|uniref:glucan 1,3-beta-glucosidase n=1 Tax=Crucibulum laeve TaxID=68775 RepID=A0A5C3MBB2_9AGAR|nr:exo-beta-1,3-glucanase [Crucibulum laeve]
MSHPNEPSRNIQYDPLPLTNDDHPSNTLYNTPPSPDPRLSSFHTPLSDPGDLPADYSIPVGAAQPRFLGSALYDDPSGPAIRDSFASSNHTIPSRGGSEYNSSVYALNDAAPARFDGSYRDDPRDTYYAGEQGGVPMSPVGQARALDEKRAAYAPPKAKSRRKLIIIAIIASILLLILAVVIPVYFAVIRPKSNQSDGAQNDKASDSDSASAAKPSGTGKPTVAAAVTGGDGSEVTMDDGTKFTYTNSFGGTWYWDEKDPFNNGARAQSWSPALNETFHYGTDKIRGVNLGGWLNTEPFISPALYEPYLNNAQPAVDEWTLSQAMAADTANGGISQLEKHYRTFITEKDFAEIASAGLNFVRIPIGYWAVETKDGEPFLAKTSWTYFLKAIKWARKYGIRINLDLHSVPGSQNGWNHSGRLGTVGFLNGPMGFANAQRSLNIIRVLAEFVSQPQYKDVVTIFGILNEPQGSVVGQDSLSRFYLEAYNIIRQAGGTGEGNGPYVSIHDAFIPRGDWAGVIPNGDRITLDSHPYLCFNGQSDADMSTYAQTPCTTWANAVNNSMSTFGLTNAGEFSNAVTDCGLFLNGVGLGTRYEGTYTQGNWPRIGSCDSWTDWQNYTPAMKKSITNFALASMDALQDYFFWTWKIGNSSVSGKVETPAWSYQLGLENGWMPKDPRAAVGVCGGSNPFVPPLQAWQTGGAGAGNIPASVSSALEWPPATLSNAGAVSTLPSYTPTGPIPTLAGPTFTLQSSTATPTVDVGNGWANPSDNAGVFVEISTCSYLDPWISPTVAPPSPLCAGGARRRYERAPVPVITKAP